MKNFLKFLENEFHCWKLLIIYMAITLWDAPSWCFTVFWVCTGLLAGFYIVVVILAVFAAIVSEINNK